MTKKRILDICMTVLMLFLMAYQVTGEELHEWIGIGMTVLIICHQVLNRRWYASLFKGKYNPYRVLTVCVDILLLAAFALTAFCGMSMSGYAVPFLYGMAGVSFSRSMHLAMSHWAFVLTGLHIGLHLPAMIRKIKAEKWLRTLLSACFVCAAGYGLFLFIRSKMTDYMLFRVIFAFLDYEKAAVLVILENLMMLLFWAFTGMQAAEMCMSRGQGKKLLRPALLILAAVLIGIVLLKVIPDPYAETFGWNEGMTGF